MCIIASKQSFHLHKYLCFTVFFFQLANILANFPSKQLNLPISNHNCKVAQCMNIINGLPKWLSGKESACKCRRRMRHGFDPWVRKIPWGRNGKPTQYSCLDNPTDREAWRAIVLGVTKSQTWLNTGTLLIFLCLVNICVAAGSEHQWTSLHLSKTVRLIPVSRILNQKKSWYFNIAFQHNLWVIILASTGHYKTF